MIKLDITKDGYLAGPNVRITDSTVNVTEEVFERIKTCDFDHAWHLVDGEWIYEYVFPNDELLRIKRENECFSIINRGRLWYEQLSDEQISELDFWYKAWLDAPETKIIPEKPTWLK